MGSGFAKKRKQQQALEAQFAKMQEEMKNTEVEGSAGNGLVKIVINGEKNPKSIKIDPQCIDAEDPEALEDLILSAFEDALKKLESSSPMGSFNPLDML